MLAGMHAKLYLEELTEKEHLGEVGVKGKR
jgi:hypothetical protein